VNLVNLAQRLNRLHTRQSVLLAELRAVTLQTPLAKIRALKHEFERNASDILRLETRLKGKR
jgi:hypothetical protein